MLNNATAPLAPLESHARKMPPLQALFQDNPKRFSDFSLTIPGLTLDFSRQRITADTLPLLKSLLDSRNFTDWRQRMFSGDIINTTEKRAVLHTALRAPAESRVLVAGGNVIPGIHATLKQMEDFCNAVHTGSWRGHTGKAIDTVINIGIGGSDLGPRMVADALSAFRKPGMTVHFVSNVDGHDLARILPCCNPETTLLVIASKTFTTAETMMNAKTARAWLVKNLGADSAIERHAVAVSCNVTAAQEFGIAARQVFPFGEWVGGRFSVWSSIGLSVALSTGFAHFRQFLDGAHAMDRHFLKAPDLENMPVILALLDIWNRNYLGTAAIATLPYDQRLRLFAAWLRQTMMESNGKSVDRDGNAVCVSTSPIIFGVAGTDCQHSFMQLVHQGTDIIPCDFIGALEHDHPWPDHHRMLLANMVAQADAMMQGRSIADSCNDPQRSFPGNRPSTIFLLDRLDPWHLGLLMALNEHRVFVQGILWNINSFDQFGVELGKAMANQALDALSGDPANTSSGMLALIAKRLRP